MTHFVFNKSPSRTSTSPPAIYATLSNVQLHTDMKVSSVPGKRVIQNTLFPTYSMLKGRGDTYLNRYF